MRALRLPLRLLFTAVTLMLLTTAGRAASAENLVTCDELPPQPTDGVHVNGVRFYTYGEGNGGGGDAPVVSSIYGDEGPGVGAYVQDPSIITNNYYDYTVLGMEFDTPTNNLQLGIALDEFGTLPQGAFVDLYAANEDFIATIPISTSSVFAFSEGLFNYNGPPVKFAEVYTDYDIDAYAVDNIRFGTLVNRTQGSGEGVTPTLGNSRYTAVLSAKATSLGHGTGFFYLIASGSSRGTLRSTKFNTVMLFGNRAVVTGTATVTGLGAVRFAAEIVDGGTGRGADRVSVGIVREGFPEFAGQFPIVTGDFRVR